MNHSILKYKIFLISFRQKHAKFFEAIKNPWRALKEQQKAKGRHGQLINYLLDLDLALFDCDLILDFLFLNESSSSDTKMLLLEDFDCFEELTDLSFDLVFDLELFSSDILKILLVKTRLIDPSVVGLSVSDLVFHKVSKKGTFSKWS